MGQFFSRLWPALTKIETNFYIQGLPEIPTTQQILRILSIGRLCKVILSNTQGQIQLTFLLEQLQQHKQVKQAKGVLLINLQWREMLVQIAGVDKREIDWIKKCPLFWLQLLVPIELLSICIYHLSSLLGAIWRRISELLRRINFEDLLGTVRLQQTDGTKSCKNMFLPD